jgi:hypothetical protein
MGWRGIERVMSRDARGVGWWCMSVGLVVGVLFGGYVYCQK